MLTPCARILMALNHQESDRVPIDFGGTTATSVLADAYKPLKTYLGLALDQPIQFEYPRTEIVRVDEAIVRRLGGDVLPIRVQGTNLLHYADQPTSLAERGYIDEYAVVFSEYRLPESPRRYGLS